MRKLFALAAAALMLTSTASMAHFPEGQIFGAWQWPSDPLPNLDGDISEWNVLPAELWIDIFQTEVAEGDIGREIDTANLNFRVAVGWNDELDRVYYVYDRFDDIWDRDAGGFGCCGHDHSIEIFLDSDHSADRFAFWDGDYEDAEERARNNGRANQTGHYRWPALEPFGFYWFWLSSSTWHDKEPYSCCPDSFNLDGAHGTESNFRLSGTPSVGTISITTAPRTAYATTSSRARSSALVFRSSTTTTVRAQTNRAPPNGRWAASPASTATAPAVAIISCCRSRPICCRRLSKTTAGATSRLRSAVRANFEPL